MGNAVIYRPAYDAEVEYLESTGTQYIDTGVFYSTNKSISCDINVNILSTSIRNFGCIIGCETSANTYNFRLCVVRQSNQIDLKQTANNTDTLELDKFINVNVPSSMDYITIDGTNFPTDNWTSKGIATYMPLYLFALNRGNMVADLSNMRISSAKIWNQGTLVRDFIPVRIDSVGYLYDKVSKQLFANKGTGNFILGNDVSNAVIPQQRCVLYFGNQRSVGFERIYEEYDWLCGDGVAYISIPMTRNQNWRVSAKERHRAPITVSYIMLYGVSRGSENNKGWFAFSSPNGTSILIRSADGSSNRDVGQTEIPVNQINTIVDTHTEAVINGVTFQNIANRIYANIDRFYIYSAYDSRYAGVGANADFAYFTVEENGTNILSLIPCKLLQSISAILDGNGIARQAGECGFWDKTNNRFYGNVANSGSFTVLNN